MNFEHIHKDVFLNLKKELCKKYKISKKLMQFPYAHIENKQLLGKKWEKFNNIL